MKRQLINQNVEIWVKRGDWSKCSNLIEKAMINQYVEIWVWKSIKILKFECQMSNRSKCWNLSKNERLIKCWYFTAKVEIDQNVGVWLKNKELIRMLKFECKMLSWSKCWNLSEKGRLIKMSKFQWKGVSMKTLKFEDRVGNQSKCWNLTAND